MKIIIYATHSFGTYETLIQHPDVICLGFGTTWEGFIKKGAVICDYLEQLPEDEIVAVIDGFDSYIRKTDGMVDAFLQHHCRVLVSIHQAWFSNHYMDKKVFSECKDGNIANSGLMMGYVKEVKQVYTFMHRGPSDDDQRNLNIACHQMPYLKIDTACSIFQNCSNMTEVKTSNAYICQIPGDMSLHRIIRFIGEYPKYFKSEMVLLGILVMGYVILTRMKSLSRILTKVRMKARVLLSMSRDK